MNIDERFLTRNAFSRPGRLLNPVRGIVIHWVANANSTALANLNYFEGLKNQKKVLATHDTTQPITSSDLMEKLSIVCQMKKCAIT